MKTASVTRTALAVLIIFGLCGYAAAFSGAGSGTEADPYVITTVLQLQEMGNDLAAYYVLGNDIDASDTVNWNGGEGFVPIGTYTEDPNDEFRGILDGRGHSIQNLFLNRIDSFWQGLFGSVWGGTITNVHLINAVVSGDMRVATLAGLVHMDSTVTYCSSTGTVTLKAGTLDSKSGGLLGAANSGSQINECFSGVNVNAGDRKQVGGLVGTLVGRTYYTLLRNSYSTGTVTGGGGKQGNLVGDADGSYVDRCYSCGYEKALIGFNWENPVITNSYWDMDKGASSSSYGGTPKTTSEMMQQLTFVDWDFVNIWDIEEGVSYPFLRGVGIEPSQYATNPDPADGAVIEGPDVLLSWTPGIEVTQHDVYMGTSWEDVNNAVYDEMNPPPEYIGTVLEPSILVNGLLENTTYYWRVDEVYNRLPLPIGGGTYYTGDVWSFNTGGGGELRVPSQYATIQEAIDVAVNGDEVIVADGIYTGIGNKNLDFNGKAITVRSENGSHVCVIDCQNIGRGAYFSDGEGAGSILKGFAITNGNESRGGGIYITNSSPTIINCIIKNNYASSSGGIGGAGFYITGSSTNPRIINCLIDNNVTPGDGGGVEGTYGASLSLVNCTIVRNQSDNAPGVGCHVNCTVFLTNTVVWYNQGNTSEYISNGDESDTTLTNCNIEGGLDLIWNPGGGSVIDNGGNIELVPEFRDPTGGDFDILATSPCVNAGENSAVPAEATTDIAGNPRIIDGVVDIGAYEAESDGPIAHWKFDEGTGGVAYDSAGDNDGTLVNGPIWTTGILDGALDFDGVKDYVDCGNDSSLNVSSQFSFSVWFNANTLPSPTTDGAYWLLGKDIYGKRSYNFGLWYLPDVGARLVAQINGNNIPANGANTNIKSGTWYHAVVTYDGSDIIYYLNSELDEVASSEDAVVTDEILYIGKRGYVGYEEYFDGTIDDVRIYDRALSAAEVEELYNSAPVPPAPKIYYVDGVNGSDLNDGESLETAFATIQMGIDAAEDGNSVLVYPAVYDEALLINNKAIRLQGVATSDGIPIIQKAGDYAVSYYVVEGPDSLLKNFVIRGSELGILIVGGSPTISNVTVVDNVFGLAAYAGATPDISNCIFWNNTDGDLFGDPVPLEAKYSLIQEEVNEPTLTGLVSHWMFDEGTGSIAYDSAGDNDGTIYGAAWTTGQIGGALDFDDVDDYVEVGDDPSLRFTQYDSFSICLWAKPVESMSGGYIVCKMRASHQSGYFGYVVSVSTIPKFYFNIEKSMYSWVNISTGEASFDEWSHVSAVYDNKDMKIYLNGELEGSGIFNLDTGYTSPDKDLAIGARSVDSLIDNFFNGALDDVLIYNRALSAEEIEEIYNVSQPGQEYDPLFGDNYHLLSERGRHWPEHDVWVLDKVTSPCIDGGDPAIDPSNEPMPNGDRINMGAYGNTAYASMSEWPLKYDGNFDGIVNMLDLAGLAQEWLGGEVSPLPPPPPPPTLPGQASNPNPADGATNVPKTIYLSWTPGDDAVSHDVYFGETNPPDFQGNVISPMFGPGSLAYGMTYYWRIDEVNSSGTTTGNAWTFTTTSAIPPPPGMP